LEPKIIAKRGGSIWLKKVLFIYYHFPPIIGDWRGVGLAGHLPEFGWQPMVISAAESSKYAKDYSLLQKIPNGIEIHRVGHREPSGEWQYIRNKLRINYDFPDYFKGWYSPVLREARKILQREKIDLIFSSAPPYTSALIAMQLKKEFNIPWVAEWRDLWSGNEFLNLAYDKTLMRPLRDLLKFKIKRSEKDILRTADKTIIVCWYQKKQLCELQGIKEDKIEIITNGYDESDFKELTTHTLYPDKLNIVFLGSFYPQFREPILKFLEVVGDVAGNAEVAFIGRGAIGLQDINMPNLTCVLHLVKEKALALAAGSDFLFLVMPPYAKWIPMKIYEYLRIGKPVLALVPQDGDVAKIVEEAKAGFVLSHERDRMKEQLSVIFNQWREGRFKDFHPDGEYVSQFERRNLTTRLADIFNEVSAQRK